MLSLLSSCGWMNSEESLVQDSTRFFPGDCLLEELNMCVTKIPCTFKEKIHYSVVWFGSAGNLPKRERGWKTAGPSWNWDANSRLRENSTVTGPGSTEQVALVSDSVSVRETKDLALDDKRKIDISLQALRLILSIVERLDYLMFSFSRLFHHNWDINIVRKDAGISLSI